MDGVNQLWLEAPEVARETQPGQFVMVRCGEGWDPLLRRALSIHRVRREAATFALLYGVRGKGTAALAHKRPGDVVECAGAAGQRVHGTPQRRTIAAGRLRLGCVAFGSAGGAAGGSG